MDRPHTTLVTYTSVFLWLAALTLLEIGISQYVPIAPRVRPAVLLALAVTKAALVALYYMHLKFDRRIFLALFIVPLLGATGFIFAVTH